MNYPHPLLAREGWAIMAGALLLAMLFSGAGLWSLPFWLLLVFCVQFFRDPPRVIAGGPKSVLAAADGRVVAVAEADDPYLNRRAIKISVFMNVFNVHSNRSPIKSNVLAKWYMPGSFLNAALDKASLENERNALQIRTASGQEVTCVQIAGLIARRILCYVEPGATLARGQRYGFIRFGSRVDVYLDPAARPRVAVGDVVAATETILAELP